jgi:hypothetical protein
MNTTLIEYMKLHIISLEQDAERIRNEMDSIEDLNSDEYNNLDIEDIYTNGQIVATRHILNVAEEMERK